MACAGELYFSATFSVALILTLLRFGPRQPLHDDMDDGRDPDDEEHEEIPECNNNNNNNTATGPSPDKGYGAASEASEAFRQNKENSVRNMHNTFMTESERSRLLKSSQSTRNLARPRATLGGVM